MCDISRFQLINRIPMMNLKRQDEHNVDIKGICGSPNAGKFLLADYANGTVREIDIDNSDFQLCLKDVYRHSEGESVDDVTYSNELKTLFIATSQNGVSAVRTFDKLPDTSVWKECHRLQTTTNDLPIVFMRVLGNGMLFCLHLMSEAVYVCRVKADRSMELWKEIDLKEAFKYGFDVQLVGNETRIAVAMANEKEKVVVIYRWDGDSLKELTRSTPSRQPFFPHFCGDMLLVQEYAGNNKIDFVSFSHKENGLKRERVVLSEVDRRLPMHGTCYVDGMLAILQVPTRELLLYKAVRKEYSSHSQDE